VLQVSLGVFLKGKLDLSRAGAVKESKTQSRPVDHGNFHHRTRKYLRNVTGLTMVVSFNGNYRYY